MNTDAVRAGWKGLSISLARPDAAKEFECAIHFVRCENPAQVSTWRVRTFRNPSPHSRRRAVRLLEAIGLWYVEHDADISPPTLTLASRLVDRARG